MDRSSWQKRKATCLLLLLSGFCGFAQWERIPEKVRAYVEQASGLRSRTGLPDDHATLRYCQRAVLFYKANQLDSAYKYALQALADGRPGDDAVAIAALIKAETLYQKNFYRQSLREYVGLLRLPRLDDVLRRYLNVNMGAICIELQEYAQALPYLLQAVQDSALDASNRVAATNNIGVCYLNSGDLPSANLDLKKCVAAATQARDTAGLAYIHTNIGNQYYNQYLDAPALAHFRKALFHAQHTDDFSIKEIAYRNMAVFYENKQQYRAALDYRKSYEATHDSLYNRDQVWGTAQEKNRVDSMLNARKIQLEQQTNRLQALELEKRGLELRTQRQHLHFFWATSVALLAFFVYAVSAYRRKIRQNRVIAAQREALDRLNQTKDQLFSIVAHDLRSPMQALRRTFAELKNATAGDNRPQAQRRSNEVEAHINGVFSLLNNLLYWAMSQTGQLRIARDKLLLGRLVEQVLYDYLPVAALKGISLQNQVPNDLCCTGDPNTVKIILRNLIDNAIKFSEPHLPVTISGVEETNTCVVAVRDYGKGMEAGVIQELTSPAATRSTIRHAQAQGTGIGLWLVKTMVAQHSGDFAIQQEDRGTTMIVRLPKSHSRDPV